MNTYVDIKFSAHDEFQYRNIGKPNNLKVSGSNKPKALNSIAKIGYNHICLSITISINL